MKVLELFSGTHSIGKACDPLDEIVSLDIIGDPTIKMDILQWDYKVYPTGYFDYIHASPPCTEYSQVKAVTLEKRNFALADSFVLKALEIIDYFKPNVWTLENPQTGHLKNRSFMWSLPFTDVDYCKYGGPVRKRTRMWNNFNLQLEPMCRQDCKQVELGSCGKLVHAKTKKWITGNSKRKTAERAIIPHSLCVNIIHQIKARCALTHPFGC